MTPTAIIGIVIVLVSVCLLVALALWSRARIERIASAAGRSAREIERQLDGD
jgi:type II secretory pathway pseudopilin PulG